jgi:ABC-type cobalamin transport system permease subunit
MVQIMHSALLFCGEVYGQDIRRITLLVVKNAREDVLSNSRPLLQWTALMMLQSCVETKAIFFDKVEKVSY